MDDEIDIALWQARISRAREQREKHVSRWRENAHLVAKATEYRATREANDDELVYFPNGDQVHLGLVFRNIDQTMGLLDSDSITVTAEKSAVFDAYDAVDMHQDLIAGQAVYESLRGGKLFNPTDYSDLVKLDGLVCGHGVVFGMYEIETESVQIGEVEVYEETDSGDLVPKFDKNGAPLVEPVMGEEIVRQGVEDRRISPLALLFDSYTTTVIQDSPWIGYEEQVRIEDLKSEFGDEVVGDLIGGPWRDDDLQYFEQDECQHVGDYLIRIRIWDKDSRKVIDLVEGQRENKNQLRKGRTDHTQPRYQRSPALEGLSVADWPVMFDGDGWPASFFVPIPSIGNPRGTSQVDHIRNPSMEADKLRTRIANLTRQLKYVLLYQKGKVDSDQLTKALLSANPTEPVGVDVNDDDDWDKLFKRVEPTKIPPELYRAVSDAVETVRWTSGVSEQPFGGADTATESENIMQVGSARVDRRRRKFFECLSHVGQVHLAYLREFAPEGQWVEATGSDGSLIQLPYGRAALSGRFFIRVAPGNGGAQISPVKMKQFLDFAPQLFEKFGPHVDLMLLNQGLLMFEIPGREQIMAEARRYV
ncbi:MAG: hypothetical protein OEY63_07055, partial [Gemmatimonadota bacterium]|nr:hypothetical protein [Gemmatimonadota bacterium]